LIGGAKCENINFQSLKIFSSSIALSRLIENTFTRYGKSVGRIELAASNMVVSGTASANSDGAYLDV
jgi:hypothetical protein